MEGIYGTWLEHFSIYSSNIKLEISILLMSRCGDYMLVVSFASHATGSIMPTIRITTVGVATDLDQALAGKKGRVDHKVWV